MQGLLKYLRLNACVCVIVGGCLVHEGASERDKDGKLDMVVSAFCEKQRQREEKNGDMYSAHLSFSAFFYRM